MKSKISVTTGAVAAARDVVVLVDSAREAECHVRAAERYREERRIAAAAEVDKPWWIDIGGEGEPC